MSKSLARRIEALEQRFGLHGPEKLTVFIRRFGRNGASDDTAYRYAGPLHGNMIERGPGEMLDDFMARVEATLPPTRQGDVSVYELSAERD